MSDDQKAKRVCLDGRGRDEGAADHCILPREDCPPPPPPGSPPSEAQACEQPPPPPPGSPPPSPDESGIDVKAALQRITSHIGNPKKLGKAVALVKKLLCSGACRKQHAELLLQVLDASLRRPQDILDPVNRQEYRRLFRSIDEYCEGIFNDLQQRRLDVYRLLGVSTGALLSTDDSFVFNKLVGELKGVVRSLPPSTASCDTKWKDLQDSLQLLRSNGYSTSVRETGPPGAAPSIEDDPFGLNSLMDYSIPVTASKKPSDFAALFDEDTVELMRKEALLECFRLLKSHCYVKSWARTSIDIALMELWDHADCFCPSQQSLLNEFKAFVTSQRAKRKQGPSAREARRDTTEFEKARASWSASKVSHRGNVGAGGDHKAETWLG